MRIDRCPRCKKQTELLNFDDIYECLKDTVPNLDPNIKLCENCITEMINALHGGNINENTLNNNKNKEDSEAAILSPKTVFTQSYYTDDIISLKPLSNTSSQNPSQQKRKQKIGPLSQIGKRRRVNESSNSSKRSDSSNTIEIDLTDAHPRVEQSPQRHPSETVELQRENVLLNVEAENVEVELSRQQSSNEIETDLPDARPRVQQSPQRHAPKTVELQRENVLLNVEAENVEVELSPQQSSNEIETDLPDARPRVQQSPKRHAPETVELQRENVLVNIETENENPDDVELARQQYLRAQQRKIAKITKRVPPPRTIEEFQVMIPDIPAFSRNLGG